MGNNPRRTLTSVSARFLIRDSITVVPMSPMAKERFATACQIGPGGDRRNPSPVTMAEKAAMMITGDDWLGVEYIARNIKGAR